MFCCSNLQKTEGLSYIDLLASAINDIHSEYQIRDKVICTTSDSGSNFKKAFRVFGAESNDVVTVKNKGEGENKTSSEHCDEGTDCVEFQDAFLHLDQEYGFNFQMPKHQRCACHILN